MTLAVPDALVEARRCRLAGRLAEAEALCRQVLEIEPANALAHQNMGLVLFEAGRYEDALVSLGKALQNDPASHHVYNAIGAAHQKLGRLPEAIAGYETALRLNKDFVDAYSNLGVALLESDGTHAAAAVLREGLRLAPDRPNLHSNMAVVLTKARRPDEAEVHLREAVRLDPNYVEAHKNLAVVLIQQARPLEALRHFEIALRLQPESPRAHFDLALTLLALGRYAEGWREAEWRWQVPSLALVKRPFEEPQWKGEEISRKTLMLYGEQGFGDILQFSRYVPLAAARAKRLSVEAPPALERLFRLSFARDNIRIVPLATNFPGVAGLPKCDYSAPLLSLPLAFGTTLETIPAESPYLAADAAEIAAWSRRLAELPQPRVGLVWAGAAANPRDRERSIALARLAPLAEVEGVAFISLQKDATAAQAAAPPPRMKLHDFTAELADFAATAALISALDLVISVDTAVVHLAGALGKPVWLLNPFETDWRWLIGRDDSPWYPRLRILRQPRLDDWDSVIARVRDELRHFAQASAGRPAKRGMRQRIHALRKRPSSAGRG